MNLNSYRENISLQIKFLTDLKEKASENAKKTIDATLDIIYEDIKTKITPTEIDGDLKTSSQTLIDDRAKVDALFTELITEYNAEEKKTRRIANRWNLSVIILSIIVSVIFLLFAYFYTNNISKSYLISEQNKYLIIDNLEVQSLKEYSKILKKLDSFVIISKSDSTKSTIDKKNIISSVDSLKTNLKEVETIVTNINSKDSEFSKVQSIFYFHILIMLICIIAIITVLMYIVKVEVNLFRYNNILADHYEALAGSFKILRNSSIFGTDINFEKIYPIMHPQRDKLLEVNAAVDLDPDKIIEKLSGMLEKIKPKSGS
jgi:hypothetical protein